MRKALICIALLSLCLWLSPAHAFSPELLKNAVYHGIYDDPVSLRDGRYEGEPFVEGGASRPSVTLVDALTAFGDLNGDGLDDAAAVLVEDSGGSGSFSYLAVLVNRDEEALNHATLLLGDRVTIKSISIEDGQVFVNIIEQNEKVRKGYQFSFVESSSENLGPLGFSDLEGVEWVLTGLTPGEKLVPGTEITAVFEGESISGASGCNRYMSKSEENSSRDLQFGPSAGTRKLCPQAIMKQERAFLSALETVSQFSFSAGNLLLEHETGRLMFRPRPLVESEKDSISLEKLEGTIWTLAEIAEGEALVPESEITVSFAEGKISGSNGCNQYSAAITENSVGEISIGMAMGTMKTCSEEVMEQENAFMAKLVSVKHARLNEGRLELIHENDRLIFLPKPAESE